MKKSQFETALANFKGLAESFVEFGVNCKFQLRHYTSIGTAPSSWPVDPTFRVEGKKINLYFGDDYKSWSLELGDIKITSWYQGIQIPWAITTKEMVEIFNDAHTLLLSLNTDEFKAEIEKQTRARVEKEIKEMEAKLETLKNSIHENVEQSN